ncbi:MAG: glycosyltransferase family 1 protein [Verrucomicrobiota bacterium]
MRVALDTNHRFILQGGVSRYIEHLLHGFSALRAPAFEWFELNWPVTNYEYRQPIRAFKTFYREMIWGRFIGPRRLAASGADLLHSLDFPILTRIPCRHVLTLHDLGYIRTPDRFRRWTRLRARARLVRCHEADKVICISQFTADEAIKLIGLSAARIEVVHLGPGFADPEFSAATQAPDLPLPPEFFLFVGHLDPNKNLSLLREIYELAAREQTPLPPLVIAGKRWEGVSREGPPPDNWIFLGRQPDAVLRHLFAHAIANVFPSRYEGFGMTVLEAMSCGCPVICSPLASIPEIAGDAALFVKPDAGEYLCALRSVMDDPALRGELREKGRQRAAQFSWRKCAAQTLDVYRHLV